MEADFEYPNAAKFMLRRRLGLLLRLLRLRPPENINHALHARMIAELEVATNEGLTERPFDYGGDVGKAYLGYADGRLSAEADHTFYPRLFFTSVRDAISADRDIKTVLNFGAFFANVDATLALLNPAVQFRAVDYAPEIQQLNESIFAGANIRFLTSRIEAAISDPGYERPGLLAHCKTACLMYPAKIERLYKLAAEQNIRCIVGVENTGFCWGLGDFYEFTDQPKPSAFHKSTMFAHNYPAMLKAAGYTVRSGRVAYDGLNYAIVFVATL